MISVAVVGALGRMGSLVAETVAGAGDLSLVAAVDRVPGSVAGVDVRTDLEALQDTDVAVDFTEPAGVLANLSAYRKMGIHAVIGTSGFTEERLDTVRSLWDGASGNCLIVPNFSIGAVLMMRFAEEAARYFAAAEVVELHHDRKADAPSGTSVATAGRLAGTPQRRAVESAEVEKGARGADVAGVRVHSVRLPGLLAHQEVLMGNPGEILTIRHDSTDRISFMPGVVEAIRGVGGLPPGVTVGLDAVL